MQLTTEMERSAQFVRMDNRIIRCRAQGITRLDDVGLYALLSAFLSIPDFRVPAGGLHHLIANHCSNGRYSIHAAWKRLSQAGYLKRTRLPDPTVHFRDLYALSLYPDCCTPAVHHLGYLQGRRLLEQHRCFTPPTENFTPVSRTMLMDAGLSLSAKGLYALIRQRLLLSSRVGGVTLNRESLRRSSGMGECAFRRVWNELKNAGYLTLTHAWDTEKKQSLYRYTLAEQAHASETIESISVQGGTTLPKQSTTLPPKVAILSPRQATVNGINTDNQERAAVILNGKFVSADLNELIQDQIEYDTLVARENPKALLDSAVEVIAQVMLLPPNKTIAIRGATYPVSTVQRALRKLDANEVEYALRAVEKAAGKQQIQNLRAYLLTCLFTAKTDFALSLTLF